MDEALIKHAQHDIDHYDGGQDQQHFVGQCRLECERGAFELGGDAGWSTAVGFRLLDRVHRRAQRVARRHVEGNWDRWSTCSGVGRCSTWAIADNCTCPPPAVGRYMLFIEDTES